MTAGVQVLGGSGGGRLARRIVGFVRLLRDNGFAAGPGETMDALRLARGCDLGDPAALRGGLRALLCASRLDWRRFDELFDAYWLGRGMKRAAPAAAGGETPAGNTGAAGAQGAVDGGTGAAAGEAARHDAASAAESLARRDLRHINDPDELARVYELAERWSRRMKARLTRRTRVRRRGRRLDLRRVIHDSIRFGGTPLRLAYRKRWPKPLKLVVILDVSGSMSLYSAFFVRFVRGVLDHFRDADAFVFHTRLVHIGTVLRERDVEKALQRMALIAAGWDGGTRIGDSLATFNRSYAQGVINSRTALIIVSDGYDTGPPEQLAAEMARLRRRVKRIIWLNPMIGWRDYRPAAAGMAAALPYVDLFAPAHNLESLAALEPYLAKL